jgi:phosphatidylinositol-3-phosphatase
MKSPAYRQDGMLIITFDEADLRSDPADYERCCDEKHGPNTIAPGRKGSGGGRIGAVIVSPYVRPGTLDRAPYNHYSLLKSLEVLFNIRQFLGYASQPGLKPFGPDVYDAGR